MSLRETSAAWDRLGATDPLWAVLVEPGKQCGRWDPAEFFDTGRAEVDAALAVLDEVTDGGAAGGGRGPGAAGGRHGPDAGAAGGGRGRALDFGCGVGRLSQALAAHYDEVVGVDVAPSMLAAARRFDRTGRCTFVHNDKPDLAVIPSASVDLVFSSLVLQHIPPAAAAGYLREFARVVRPGGAVIVAVPTATRRTVKGLVFRWAPRRLVAFGQRRFLGYPAPMRMHTIPVRAMTALLTSAGLTVRDAREDRELPHWRYTRFIAVR